MTWIEAFLIGALGGAIVAVLVLWFWNKVNKDQPFETLLRNVEILERRERVAKALFNWGGITGPDGKEMSYTKENIDQLLQDHPGLSEDVIAHLRLKVRDG